MPRRVSYETSLFLLVLMFLPSILPPCLLCLQGVDIDVPFRAEHSTFTYFMRPDQVSVSFVTTDHCEKKFFFEV